MMKTIASIVLLAGLLKTGANEPARPVALPPPAPVIEKPAPPREVWVEEEVAANVPSFTVVRLKRSAGCGYVGPQPRRVLPFEMSLVIGRRPDFMRKPAR